MDESEVDGSLAALSFENAPDLCEIRGVLALMLIGPAQR
jgi:hypothetical protein